MQDQVVSGAKRWQTKMFANLGELLKLRLVDELHVVGYRAQPQRKCQHCKGEGRVPVLSTLGTTTCLPCCGSGKVDMVQKHAAGNVSTLQIYRR
jgi:DnaJ-class molecular chaperone